ncbi:MAG: hypothetical protein ACRC0L_09305, partial [Angustibacter sp.]
MSSRSDGFFGWPTEEPEPDGVSSSTEPKARPLLGFPLADQLVPEPTAAPELTGPVPLPARPDPMAPAEFRFP